MKYPRLTPGVSFCGLCPLLPERQLIGIDAMNLNVGLDLLFINAYGGYKVAAAPERAYGELFGLLLDPS